MIIDGKEIKNIKYVYLDPVTYIPPHAKRNANHPDCEKGVIINVNENNVFVLYCKSRTVQSTNPKDLV
jgi:hypothetical protein